MPTGNPPSGVPQARALKADVAPTGFEFAVLAGLRAAQLARGCTPRVTGDHKLTVTARREVAAGKVVRLSNGEPSAIQPT
jgi:DNA-directed RNA polymerase subunit K/omega